MRVLIVDDNEAIREALRDALSDEGFAVEAASSGEDALDRAGRSRPDLVLLDLMMPGLCGAKLAAALRTAGCAAKMIVLSADRAGETSAKEMGAAAFVAKPFDLDRLLAVIGEVAPAQG